MSERSERAQVGRGAAVGAVGSFALHAAVYMVAMALGTLPETDIEFVLPMDVELGMADEIDAVEGMSAPLPEDLGPEGEEGNASGAASDAGVEDAGAAVDAGPADAGVRDAGSADAGVDAELLAAGDEDAGTPGQSRIPEGTQIAIRLNFEVLRTSPAVEDVRALLDAIPDWHLLLDGSGIDTIEDLDRLLIASPNMRRAQVVLAGKHSHPEQGQQYIRDVVTRFSEARGATPRWRSAHGVPVVDWPNPDETPRVLAIVGPQHFVICRQVDLQRVISIARAREDARDEDLENATGADALLSMVEGDAFSVEVENVARFTPQRPGNPEPPETLRLSMGHTEGGGIRLSGRSRFADATKAEEGLVFWERQRRRAAESMAVRLLGYSPLLNAIELSREEDAVVIAAALDAETGAELLRKGRLMVEDLVRRRQQAREREERRRQRRGH